jgi:hypothetical protein
MPDYKSMYLQLFNSVTDAIDILQKAQQKGETTYVKNFKENEIIDISKSQGAEIPEK